MRAADFCALTARPRISADSSAMIAMRQQFHNVNPACFVRFMASP
jgi:hypothetical protein